MFEFKGANGNFVKGRGEEGGAITEQVHIKI